MELVTKVLKPLKNFWVEDYNEKAKKFFLDLGFEEVKYDGFEPTFKLEFAGSGISRFWNDEEFNKIMGALESLDSERDDFEWDSEIYEMNPYD